MSVPPSNQDGSLPDWFPDFLPPGGENGPHDGTPGLGDPYQQYGQPGQYPLQPPPGSLPGQPSFAYPQTSKDPDFPQGYADAYSPQGYSSAPDSPYSSQGSPDARYPNQAYPPGGNSTYPPTQHHSVGQSLPQYRPAPIPPTKPWVKKFVIIWLVAFLVFSFISGRSRWPTTPPTITYTNFPTLPTAPPLPTFPTLPTPTPPSPQPTHPTGPELPIVLEPAPVVQAIDLPEEPTLGEEWNATDGVPKVDGMAATTVITPCGVLVTFLQPSSDRRGGTGKAPPVADKSRIVGYEIATGTQLWAVDFQDATGQRDPDPTATSPTYTPDCRMIFTTLEHAYSESTREYVSVMVDLATGEANAYYTKSLHECQAVNNDWAACWTVNEVFLMSLSDFTKSPQNAVKLDFSDGTSEYLRTGGLVVSGYTWTPAGYRDPNSGDIVFGKDTHAGKVSADRREGNWVAYVEPTRPGAYRSGLVLRIEGSLYVGNTTCKAMLWDPISDTGLWDTPGEFTCGSISWSRALFIATQTALLIKSRTGKADILIAHALSDGHFIWQQEGSLTGDSSLQFLLDSASGITNNFAALLTPVGYDLVIRRVHDGASVPTTNRSSMFSNSMVYTSKISTSDNQHWVEAYSLDADDPSTTAQRVWSLPLGKRMPLWWTFATDGKMYLVTEDYDTQAVTVRPFVS